MEGEVGRRIADEVLVVLGVVAAEERERPPAEVAVDVPRLVLPPYLAEHEHVLLDEALLKAVVCPMNPWTTLTWSCVSIVGTGSYFAENSKSVK